MELSIEQKKIDRWDVIQCISSGGSHGVGQRVIALVLEARKRIYGNSQLQTLLADLRDRGYCRLDTNPDGTYHATITPLGTDLTEYNVTCPEAIARPPRNPLPYA